MAKLPALVTALSTVDERERPTLDHFARVIREAGLIPTTKRGSGAADMTPREATNLLIAVNATDSPKLAPLAVTHFRSLKGHNRGPDLKPDGVFGRINEAANFGEAVEALIEGAADLRASLDALIDDAYGHLTDQQRGLIKKGSTLANVEVSFTRPFPSAEIKVVMPGMSEPVQYHWTYLIDFGIQQAGGYRIEEKDRLTTTTVRLKTLMTLHGALLSPGADEVSE